MRVRTIRVRRTCRSKWRGGRAGRRGNRSRGGGGEEERGGQKQKGGRGTATGTGTRAGAGGGTRVGWRGGTGARLKLKKKLSYLLTHAHLGLPTNCISHKKRCSYAIKKNPLILFGG